MLTCDPDELKTQNLVTGTPEELLEMGAIEKAENAMTLHDWIFPKKPKATKTSRKARIKEALRNAKG